MATATFIRADQHLLRVQLTDSGGAGDVDATQAQLIAACAAGPLKDLLTSALFEPPPGSGAASWGALNTDSRLSVFITPGSDAVSAGVGGYRFMAGTPNVLRLSIASGSVVVDLRYQHSSVR